MNGKTIAWGLAASTALAVFALPAGAQEAVVSGCSGVSLPRSAVTDIMRPVVEGVAAPLEDGLNGLLGSLPGGGVDTDAAGLLDDAASGQPITLSVLTTSGTVAGPDDRCVATSDEVTLDREGGIAIGGNRISGLGADGATASAGEIGSIALGNGAATAAGATNSLALGTGAAASAANSVALGAGSTTQADLSLGAFGPGGATVLGAAASGEVSVGSAGQERRVTNVAAGAAGTDAVNLSQLLAVDGRVTAVDARVTALDGTVATVSNTVNVLGSTVTNLDGRVTAIDSRVTNVEGGLTVLGDRVTNVEGDVTVLGVRVTSVEADVTVLGNRVTTIEALGLRYDGADRTRVTLAGAGGTTITNLRDGAVSAASTDAVNGSQLHETNQALLELSRTAVQYDVDAAGNPTDTVTLQGGSGTRPVRVRNVARGTAATDAANVEQLQEVEANARTYTDNRIAGLNANYDRVNARVDDVEDQARTAAAIGLAAASLRFDDTPGKISAGVGGGVWRGQGAFAAGVGYTNETGKVRVNATASVADGSVGAGAGMSFTFN